MKTFTSFLKVIAIVAVIGIGVFAPAKVYAQQSEDFTYKEEGGGITITEYTGKGGDVTIPSQINGKQVTSIGDRAFMESVTITSVTIPNGVTSIGAGAFADSSLTNVTIPNSVTKIRASAFMDCKRLTSIIIPSSVTSIETGAFNGTSLTSVTIPNSITSIENATFYDCANLLSVIIPSSVAKIGNSAFGECPNLTSVTFQGIISPGNFSTGFVFDGDLREKYLARNGGIGTYTRAKDADRWTKKQ